MKVVETQDLASLRGTNQFVSLDFHIKKPQHIVSRSTNCPYRRNIMAISQQLLDILACPKCKGDLYLTEKGDGLVCKACSLIYEIREDIPIMLIEEAKPLEK